jgi:hypothetical protein
MDSGFGDQGDQPGNEVHGFEQDMGGAVGIGGTRLMRLSTEGVHSMSASDAHDRMKALNGNKYAGSANWELKVVKKSIQKSGEVEFSTHKLLANYQAEAVYFKDGSCIGIINHLFRHSDKYRGYFSDCRCDSGVPRTIGIFAGKAAARAPNNPC